jgi:integrase
LKFNGLTWEPPLNNITRKIPFIPTEQEIDDVIAGCPNAVATILQLLKERAMRSGEAISVKWIDVDFKENTIKMAGVRYTRQSRKKPPISISLFSVSTFRSLCFWIKS